MKFSIFSLFILAVLTFSACQKGELQKEEINKEGKEECFELDYPITYTMPDGSEITGDEKEVWEAMKAWYEANPGSKEKPVLQYPLTIVFADETTKTIANEEEMIAVKKDCEGDEEEGKICSWDGSKVSDPAIWEEHIVEPLVLDEDCGCTVSGVVKYVKINTDFAYVVYYGKGECDEWAYLVTYYDGKDKKADKCKFKLDCEAGGN